MRMFTREFPVIVRYAGGPWRMVFIRAYNHRDAVDQASVEGWEVQKRG